MLQYPKIELHLHLDCSLSYEVVAKIDPSITREAYLRDFVAPTKCASLADFLTRAPRAIALMQTADRLRMVVKDLFEQLQRDSVLYAEIRFAPLLHTEQGIFRTAHAGEASGAESVWETLKHLRPTRIGHGVRSSEDPALVAVLRAEQIHLEICPMSNIQTNIYETYADHPIDRLYRESLSLGVSTDTRMITPVTLRQEYEQLHHCFGWDRQHFLRCNLSALQAAFLPEEKKHELGQRLQLAYASYD